MHLYSLSIKKYSPSHGIKWNFPTTLTAKGVGEGILFLWLEVLFGSNKRNSWGDQIGQCDLVLALTTRS